MATTSALDNDGFLTDSMLDHKRIYENYFSCDRLFSATEDVKMGKEFAEESTNEEWGYCSDSLGIGHWKGKAKEKCDLSAAIPKKSCAKMQFKRTNTRNEVEKYFSGRLSTIKKAQRKDSQHDNQ